MSPVNGGGQPCHRNIAQAEGLQNCCNNTANLSTNPIRGFFLWFTTVLYGGLTLPFSSAQSCTHCHRAKSLQYGTHNVPSTQRPQTNQKARHYTQGNASRLTGHTGKSPESCASGASWTPCWRKGLRAVQEVQVSAVSIPSTGESTLLSTG